MTRPKFASEYTMGSRTWLRAKTTAAKPGHLWVEAGDADGEAAIWVPRETVEEFRDLLTEWLGETEVKAPTTVGSRIVDHSPSGDREYMLLPFGATHRASNPFIEESPDSLTWVSISGDMFPGWETADVLTGHLSSGRAEVVYDAGA